MEQNKLFWIVVFVFLDMDLTSGSIIINEMMYDPLGSDDGHEWIEIYNNGTESIDMVGCKFFEDNTNHGLSVINGSYILDGNNYAVIADEYDTFLLDYPYFNSTLFDSSWSSLSNSGEYVAVKNSSLDIIDFVNYSNILIDEEGRSLERFVYGWNESGNVGGTPGKQNNDTIFNSTTNNTNQTLSTNGLKLTVYISETVFVGMIYTSLFKIENLDHISGTIDTINLTIGYNITLENETFTNQTILTGLNSYKTAETGYFSPTIPGNYTIIGWIINSSSNDTNKNDDISSKNVIVIDTSTIPCNISINISSDKEIYNESEQVKFDNMLNNESFPFIIEYWIEDFFGNFYKSKYNSTNTNQKTWTTEISEEDRVLFIKSKVYPNCNDSNLSDNIAEKMFIVKSTQTNLLSNSENNGDKSSLEIEDADETAQFGDIVNVKLNAYKGDTSKYSIQLYIEKEGTKASEITKFNLKEKYSSYEGQIPIQIKSNCDLKLENGRYDLVIEGIDEKDTKKITIEGLKKSMCDTKSVESLEEEKESKIVYEKCAQKEPTYLGKYNIINQLLCTDSIHYKNVIYESNNEQLKKMIPSFIIGTLALLSVILILKRETF